MENNSGETRKEIQAWIQVIYTVGRPKPSSIDNENHLAEGGAKSHFREEVFWENKNAYRWWLERSNGDILIHQKVSEPQ